jgi:arylsulfatase A-like enzyme
VFFDSALACSPLLTPSNCTTIVTGAWPGPGVRKGEHVERNVWLTDVCPTICHLASLPVPKQCEGAIAYQALEEMR